MYDKDVPKENQDSEFGASKSNDHGGLFLSPELQNENINDSTSTACKLIKIHYIFKKYCLFKII